MLFEKKETLSVKGMSCGHCEKSVEQGLSGVAGVKKVKADHTQDQVTVYYKGDPPEMEAVKKQIVELGFEVA